VFDARAAPLSPYKVNATDALDELGLTRAKPVVLKSCGCMTRAKFNVDWAWLQRGISTMAMTVRTPRFTEPSIESIRNRRSKKEVENQRPEGAPGAKDPLT
jgi:hypothetical protein